MWFAFKRLALGITLILLTSAVLLSSDLGRRTSAPGSVVKIAILQHASSPVLDDGITGMIQGLAEHGFADGAAVTIQRFNAEADMAVGNAIASQIVNGDYDLVLTSSTPSMQAVANANREGRVRHVFGIVADPFVAGIGLDRADPMKHPKHMVGQSTFLPVNDVFRLVKESLPGLRIVGTAWNPAEANSRAFVMAARETCRTLGITLLEANVDNTSAVVEAVNSVIARGAQAFWIPGDNVMMSTVPTTVETARHAGIPVFTITPGKPDRGTFLDVGLDFVEVGRLAGALAASVLRGTDPATIPIRDVLDEVPQADHYQYARVEGTERAVARAGGSPQHGDDPCRRDRDPRQISEQAGPQGGRTSARQAVECRSIEYNTVVDVEEAEEGVLGGLRDSGLVEARDYSVRIRNAQGDMATMNSLVDAAISDRTDLLITFSTPTLQAAIQRSQGVPVVFNYVANAVWAGAGRSDTDHLPNVTGVYLPAAYDEMLALIREVLPHARVLGTLYVPSEVNTVYHRDRFGDAARQAGHRIRDRRGEHVLGSRGCGAVAGQPKDRRHLSAPGQPHGLGFPHDRRGGTALQAPALRLPDERRRGRRPSGRGARLSRRWRGGSAPGRADHARREPRRRCRSNRPARRSSSQTWKPPVPSVCAFPRRYLARAERVIGARPADGLARGPAK